MVPKSESLCQKKMNCLGYVLTFRSLLRVFDEGKEEDVERGLHSGCMRERFCALYPHVAFISHVCFNLNDFCLLASLCGGFINARYQKSFYAYSVLSLFLKAHLEHHNRI